MLEVNLAEYEEFLKVESNEGKEEDHVESEN